MQVPFQLTFRHMDPSPALADRVRELTSKLETFCDRITSCRVVIEAPHHRTHGDPFAVRIDISVPEREIHVATDRGAKPEHADAYVAVRDAFEAARRQLQAYTEDRQRRT